DRGARARGIRRAVAAHHREQARRHPRRPRRRRVHTAQPGGERRMTQVFLGLGSNIQPERHLELGVAELRRRYGPLALSPVYRGPAIGFAGPDFLNMVARVETKQSPRAILADLERI